MLETADSKFQIVFTDPNNIYQRSCQSDHWRLHLGHETRNHYFIASNSLPETRNPSTRNRWPYPRYSVNMTPYFLTINPSYHLHYDFETSHPEPRSHLLQMLKAWHSALFLLHMTRPEPLSIQFEQIGAKVSFCTIIKPLQTFPVQKLSFHTIIGVHPTFPVSKSSVSGRNRNLWSDCGATYGFNFNATVWQSYSFCFWINRAAGGVATEPMQVQPCTLHLKHLPLVADSHHTNFEIYIT